MQEKWLILYTEGTTKSVHSLIGDKIIMVAANPYSLPSGP